MMFRWLPHRSESVCWMHIDSPVSGPWNKCAACSAIRRRESSRSCGAQKNALRGVRSSALGLVRSHDTADTRPVPCGRYRIYLEFEARRVFCRSCQAVKREALEFLGESPFYTKRFAYYVGPRCRSATIKDIAQELHLDWDSVKELDKQYMRAQLARAGRPGPKVIGIDEVSIRKRHTYRILVSDLIRGRAIWFGGADRSEASMAQFYRQPGRTRAGAFVWR